MFDKFFFQEEIRDGFLISETMKRAWANQLDVLEAFDRVCKKHRLEWFAGYGTLLGAVRHKGYVPWDDDIDIVMKRNDYMAFLSVAKDELPSEYGIYSLYTSESTSPAAAIMNRKDIDEDDELTKKYYEFPYKTGIDLFPLDFIPDDDQIAHNLKIIYGYIYQTGYDFNAYKESGQLNERLDEIERLTGQSFYDTPTIQKQIWLLSEAVATMYNEDEAKGIAWLPDLVTVSLDCWYNKECYDGAIKMRFENITVNVPVGYEEILSTYYGDYMVPKKIGARHDYPFYKKQEKIVKQRKGLML